ncbi:hypothetical protein CHU_3566 [Cytophaga hutchinsonii ATCC 33406]|uniref:Uncharacterized protein n=2 Tax=Cytophaga hutchinsonii TaxID=985 RepID=A0A6N4SWL9_CYTH3|nr:hypothetical protein CHU_3566 [Cytophaga hutchinsonii ATCC 33406]
MYNLLPDCSLYWLDNQINAYPYEAGKHFAIHTKLFIQKNMKRSTVTTYYRSNKKPIHTAAGSFAVCFIIGAWFLFWIAAWGGQNYFEKLDQSSRSELSLLLLKIFGFLTAGMLFIFVANSVLGSFISSVKSKLFGLWAAKNPVENTSTPFSVVQGCVSILIGAHAAYLVLLPVIYWK